MSPDPKSEAACASLLSEGMAHHGEGRLGEAKRFYREILRRDPFHSEALHLLGLVAGQVGQPEVAEELLRRAIQCKPNSANLFNNLGEVLRQVGRWREAVEAYRRAIVLEPNHAPAYANAADALRAEAGHIEKQGQIRAARELRLHAAKYLAELGLIHWRRLILDRAEEAYRTHRGQEA